jgi:hypothetical protein
VRAGSCRKVGQSDDAAADPDRAGLAGAGAAKATVLPDSRTSSEPRVSAAATGRRGLISELRPGRPYRQFHGSPPKSAKV